ncbi:MAG: hypothetical protein FWG91_11190 [Lachnospiraceae bacterium]|nr:hypothetical protein [Lachnospiraceae bacterium]
MNKIHLMHKLFGIGDGFCKDCRHFTSEKHNLKKYRKCRVYGESRSEATDWNAGFAACGLFPGKPYAGDRTIVSTMTKGKREETEIPGQMTIFDFS